MATDSSRCAILIKSVAFCRAAVQQPCWIYLGCHSIWPFAFCFISGSAMTALDGRAGSRWSDGADGSADAWTSEGIFATCDRAQALAGEGRRNAEVLQAMGMRRQAALRWQEVNKKYLAAHERSSDVASGLGGASKIFRALLQSCVLAVGACLVINQESTAGIIIAGSILTARALAPVEVAIANWKGFVAARQGGDRLDRLLQLLPREAEPLELPRPTHALTVEQLYVAAPGSEKQLVSDVSFSLQSGQALGIIGPSGAGKSTLARALVGVWPHFRGKVKLDNASLEHWSSEFAWQIPWIFTSRH